MYQACSSMTESAVKFHAIDHVYVRNNIRKWVLRMSSSSAISTQVGDLSLSQDVCYELFRETEYWTCRCHINDGQNLLRSLA